MSAGDAAAVRQPDFAHHILLRAEQRKRLPSMILELPVTAMLNSRDHLQLIAQPC